MELEKIRWGVISTAKIGTEKVIPAMQKSTNCEITAIASRDIGLAKTAAEKLKIPRYYGSYQELIDDPDIDAIYNPLPNHLHVPWSVKAIEAGKHVLCEKPIALTVTEAELFLRTSQAHPDIKVMEAFMYRHHPQWQTARQIVEDGKIGTLETVNAVFSYYNTDPANIRNMAEIGGGGLMDIGCYCISLARFIFADEPQRVSGTISYDPDFKTDILANGILEFSKGTSTFTCSTQLSPYQRVNIFGSEGRIEIEIPFNAPSDKPTRVFYQHQDEVAEITFDICDQYQIQGELFAEAILNDTVVPTPLEDAIANMRVIEAIVRSDKEGAWISLV